MNLQALSNTTTIAIAIATFLRRLITTVPHQPALTLLDVQDAVLNQDRPAIAHVARHSRQRQKAVQLSNRSRRGMQRRAEGQESTDELRADAGLCKGGGGAVWRVNKGRCKDNRTSNL